MTAAIRPRTDWEAIDLGLTLLQANARLTYAAWTAVALPVALLCAAVTWSFDALWLAPVVFWWLKPLLERAPLMVLSRRLFDQDDTLAEILWLLPGTLRTSGTLAGLTVLRPGLVRSFNLPVWQLERLRGSERRARQRVLQYDTRGTAAWLTILCMMMTAVLALSLYGMFFFFVPDAVAEAVAESLFDEFGPAPADWVLGLLFGFYVTAESIVAPLYVASGFTLYLNRRTRLEAWDIELAFRRLAGRTRRRGAAAAVLVALAVGLGATAVPSIADAQTHRAAPADTDMPEGTAFRAADDPPAERSEPSLAIERVLARAEFDEYETERVWVSRDETADTTSDTETPGWLEALFEAGGLLARLSEWLIWIAVVLLAVAAWWYRNRWMPVVVRRPRGAAAPTPAAALEPEPGTLPHDIPGTVLGLWEQGRAGAALSLLYRGALDRVVRGHALTIPDGATEAECIRSVTAAGIGPAAEYFTRIARTWQRVAYAGYSPVAAQVTGLCAQWNEHFGDTA